MMHLPPPPKSDDLQDVYAIAQDLEAKLREAQQHLAAWQEEANTDAGLGQAKKVNLRRQKGVYRVNDLKTGYVPPRETRREEAKKQKKIEKKNSKLERKGLLGNRMEFE